MGRSREYGYGSHGERYCERESEGIVLVRGKEIRRSATSEGDAMEDERIEEEVE